MTDLGGQIADLVARGWSPRQDHDGLRALNQRIVTYSTRTSRSLSTDPDAAPIAVQDTRGDDLCWYFWGPSSRPTGAWAVSFPAVATQAEYRGKAPCFGGSRKTVARKPRGGEEILPLWAPDTPDRSFAPKQPKPALPKWAGPYPEDWTGIYHGDTDHTSQQGTWHPDFLGVCAPTKGGNPEHGTRVYDTTQRGKIDPQRYREISGLVSVVDTTGPHCGPQGLALALNLGPGGALEPGKPGYLPVTDWDICEIGFGAAKKGGGPLLVNDRAKTCQHPLGVTADGHQSRPVHLDTQALWLMQGKGKDAPLEFQDRIYDRNTRDVGPFWRAVHLRYDPEELHRVCSRGYYGLWRWQVRDQLTQIPKRDDDPPPPWWWEDDPPPKRREDPPPERRPDPDPRKPLRDPRGRPKTGGGPPRVCQPGDTGVPSYPATHQCMVAPGRIGQARSLKLGDADMTGYAGA